MKNPKRTQADIKRLLVDTGTTAPNGRDAWLVSILYRDGKRVEFWVDTNGEHDMLAETVRAIKFQLRGEE